MSCILKKKTFVEKHQCWISTFIIQYRGIHSELVHIHVKKRLQ